MTWGSQVLDGNPLTSYAVVFLEIAGFSEIQTFDINISICACFVIGVLICYLIFPFLGRKTIYLSGLSAMCVILIIVSSQFRSKFPFGKQLLLASGWKALALRYKR